MPSKSRGGRGLGHGRIRVIGGSVIESEIVIVGGGIAGCSTAFRLASPGRGVVLLERGTIALFFQAEDGIRDDLVTGVQTCALPIFEPQMNTDETQIGSGARAFLLYLKSVKICVHLWPILSAA